MICKKHLAIRIREAAIVQGIAWDLREMCESITEAEPLNIFQFCDREFRRSEHDEAQLAEQKRLYGLSPDEQEAHDAGYGSNVEQYIRDRKKEWDS